MNNPPAERKPGDRVWLLPDADRREVKTKLPGIVVTTLASGRVRVVYVDSHCLLTKTVEPVRIEDRELVCPEERKLARKLTAAK